MALSTTVYDTATLLGVIREVAKNTPTSYWLDLCFPRTLVSEDEYVDFAKIGDGKRKVAPFVLPTAQGKPLYSANETRARFKPAYIKPKDAVNPHRTIARVAGFGELFNDAPMSYQQRTDAVIGDIVRQHYESILRRWEWMAAKAIIDGKVTIEGEAYPEVTVDFQRDGDHTITLGDNVRWGDTGISIMEDVQTWIDLMRDAEFGGSATRLTVGTAVWAVMRKDAEIKELLKAPDYISHSGGVDLPLGLIRGAQNFFRAGSLGANLELWVYNDFYQETDNSVVPLLDSKSVVLTSPAVDGIKAFGAIQDHDALRATPIFPKMWKAEDPSALFIMHQSAPLMVPMNPNCTLKAKVLA